MLKTVLLTSFEFLYNEKERILIKQYWFLEYICVIVEVLVYRLTLVNIEK